MAETWVYVTYIRTTPEKLWEALLSPETSRKYWFGFSFQAEPRAGGGVRIVPPQGFEANGDHAGKVLACEPGRMLSYEFVTKDEPAVAAKRKKQGVSRVTYELTPMGEQVKLRLIHENLLADDIEQDPHKFRGINNGWSAIMASLKSLLETGKELVIIKKTECMEHAERQGAR